MPIALVRQGHSVDVSDADAVREWLMNRVREDVRLKGCPHPHIHLIGDGFEEAFDLDAMAKQEPAAHAGATFQVLRSRPNIERRFAVLGMEAEQHDGTQHRFALLFEEIDGDDHRRHWWMALLKYETDPTTGLGAPASAWQPTAGETDNPAQLLPFLRDLAFPPVGARAATVLGPRVVEPDIMVHFDEFPPGAPLPTNAQEMVQFAGQVAANDLLKGVARGTVVVRLAGRAWEMFVLGDRQPASLEDMVRYIANNRKPQAEGVALVQIAILPNDNPPVPGVFIAGEWGGQYVESWAPLAFPEGPAGPKVVQRVMFKPPRPVPDGGMWIGVDPLVFFDLGPLGPEA